jgi:hypothetical protein
LDKNSFESIRTFRPHPYIAIKSPESQRLYLGRLRQFLDFLGLSGSLEKQAEMFPRKTKDNGAQWTQ